jgi:hypothetical protein
LVIEGLRKEFQGWEVDVKVNAGAAWTLSVSGTDEHGYESNRL